MRVAQIDRESSVIVKDVGVRVSGIPTEFGCYTGCKRNVGDCPSEMRTGLQRYTRWRLRSVGSLSATLIRRSRHEPTRGTLGTPWSTTLQGRQGPTIRTRVRRTLTLVCLMTFAGLVLPFVLFVSFVVSHSGFLPAHLGIQLSFGRSQQAKRCRRAATLHKMAPS